MMKLKTTALAAAMAVAPMIAGAATNLVSNGGFENGLTDWSCSSAYCSNSSSANSGSSAMTGFENVGFATLSQTIETTSGTTYDVSFWARAYMTHPGNEIGYRFNGGTAVTQAATQTYSQISTSFLATGATSLIELLFATDSGTGTLFIDDVSVTASDVVVSLPETSPVPLPASLSMLMVAAGALGVAARRRRS